MIAFILAILYALFIAFDFRLGMKGAKKVEKVFYIAILTLGYGITTALCLGVNLPSPSFPIEQAVRAIFGVHP
jgi:hypothetical protein